MAHSRNLIGLKNAAARPMPGLAQPAIQQGEYVASLIGRRVEGQTSPQPFWYWDKGDLAVVGRTCGCRSTISPLLRIDGWLLWAGVHIYFLIGFANRLFVGLHWLISLIVKRRAVRVSL